MIPLISGILLSCMIMSSFFVFVNRTIRDANADEMVGPVMDKHVIEKSIGFFGKKIPYRKAYMLSVSLNDRMYEVEIEKSKYDSIIIGTTHTFSVYQYKKTQRYEVILQE